MSVLIRNARVLTLASGRDGLTSRGGGRPARTRVDRARRGNALYDLGALDHHDVYLEGDRVVRVKPTEAGGTPATPVESLADGSSIPTPHSPLPTHTIDAGGRMCMPAFVDAHTHACWAGDRLDEWELRRQGATYLEILEAGGGIMSTVRAVRAASVEELADALLTRLNVMLRHGTATVEAKSGYGLSTECELKMLRAIARAGEDFVGTVVPTACIGHAIDGPHAEFVDRTIDETLSAVHDEFPSIAIDAYCEKGAWTLDDCIRLFERAIELGHPCRVHADQFTPLGMTPAAVRMGFRSVDHLEASREADIVALAESATFGVVLPCSGFHLGGAYADARAFVDAGGAVVLATNLNPGSAPCLSMPMAIALGVRANGLAPHEAISACTVNAADVLGLPDRGTIAPDQRADLILLRHTDERELAHTFGGNPVDVVICGGVVVG